MNRDVEPGRASVRQSGDERSRYPLDQSKAALGSTGQHLRSVNSMTSVVRVDGDEASTVYAVHLVW